MADILTKINTNPIDWATRDTGFIPGDGEIWYYYNNSAYPNTIIYLIGDGTNTIDNLTVITPANSLNQTFSGLKTIDIESVSEKTITITPGTYNAIDVSNVTVLSLSTSTGIITINGFTGGRDGQKITLIKASNVNPAYINHLNASGTEKIVNPKTADLSLPEYGGLDLTYFASVMQWRSKDPGTMGSKTITFAQGSTTPFPQMQAYKQDNDTIRITCVWDGTPPPGITNLSLTLPSGSLQVRDGAGTIATITSLTISAVGTTQGCVYFRLTQVGLFTALNNSILGFLVGGTGFKLTLL